MARPGRAPRRRLDEQTQRRITAGLADTLGIEDAMALMEQVSDRPATKPDLDALESRLGSRVDDLGSRVDDLGSRVDVLGNRIDGIEVRLDRQEHERAAMEARLNERIDLSSKSVRDELRGQMHAASSDTRADLTSQMITQTRTFMLAVVGSNATIAALAFGAARLA